MCLTKLFYSKDPKPDPDEWAKHFLWRHGNKILDGNSNVFPMHPDRVDLEATLIGWPGKVPQDSIDEFNKVRERHANTPIQKAYIQSGGNIWTWYPLKSLDMNLSVFQKQMRDLITLWFEILQPADIVVASLPFVNPSVRYKDMKKYDGEGDLIRRLMNLRLNDFFKAGNILLKAQCKSLGVAYLDIYTLLENEWKQYGKSHWWDEVHYDNRARAKIEDRVRMLWATGDF